MVRLQHRLPRGGFDKVFLLVLMYDVSTANTKKKSEQAEAKSIPQRSIFEMWLSCQNLMPTDLHLLAKIITEICLNKFRRLLLLVMFLLSLLFVTFCGYVIALVESGTRRRLVASSWLFGGPRFGLALRVFSPASES